MLISNSLYLCFCAGQSLVSLSPSCRILIFLAFFQLYKVEQQWFKLFNTWSQSLFFSTLMNWFQEMRLLDVGKYKLKKKKKLITFCWSTISLRFDVLDQHRRGNTADVNLDRSEHLSVLFTNINETREGHIMFCGTPTSDKWIKFAVVFAIR